MPYMNAVLTPRTIRQLSICVAGWYSGLKRGEPFILWDGKEPVWALLYVLDVVREPGRQRRCYKATVEAYSGTLGGQTWDMAVTGAFLQSTLREVGAYKYATEYADEDLSGMWFNGLVGHQGRSLVISEVAVTEAQRRHNRDLAVARKGVCTGPLAEQLDGGPCRVCPFPRSMCRLSRYTPGYLNVKTCGFTRYGEHLGYFREENQGDVCLECQRRGIEVEADCRTN